MLKDKRKTIVFLIILVVTIFIVYFLNAMRGSDEVFLERNHRLGNTFGNLANLGQMAQDGNSIYFSSYEPDYYARLFRSDLNGNNRVLIVEYLTTNRFEAEPPEVPPSMNLPEGIFGVHMPFDLIRGINVIGDWVYYTGANRRIYKVGIDGINNQRLIDIEATRLIVYDDMIYFTCSYHKLHAMDTNGENIRLLHDNTVRGIIFYNEHIFIRRYGEIFRMDLDGNNIHEIFISINMSTYRSVYDFHIYNNRIYIELNNKIYSMDMNGENIVEISNVNRVSGEASIFYGNYFFYLKREQGFLGGERRVFHQVNLDTGNINRKNLNHTTATLYVMNNRIFFNSVIGGLHSMNFDGSNLRRFR